MLAPAKIVPARIRRAALVLLVALLVIVWGRGEGAPPPELASCLVPPAFNPGVGELYFCSPQEGEKQLIEYARQSYFQEGLQEDIWINFRGVFADQLWINVGTREANDTSLPAWEVIKELTERMEEIKKGDSSALQAFLAPIEAAPAPTEDDRALKQHLLERLRQSAAVSQGSMLRAVLYHVHLKPTREIEEKSLMPIDHMLSIPSHTDLLYAPQLRALIPGSESKIAVAAGIWTYDWDAAQGTRFVDEKYDGPANIPFPGKFGYTYTRFAITEYHRHGLNDPSAVTPAQVTRYIVTLKPAGALLRFEFASDWEAFKKSLAQAGQGK